jgi:putative ABC transport system ATP-binding protein
LIKLENVTKTYEFGNIRTYALHKINLQVEPGNFLLVMGPSGSGKSTLLNILGLLDRPNEGEYFLNTQRLSQQSLKKLTQIRCKYFGVIFQNFNLISDLNVYHNVELPLIYHNEPLKIRREKVEAILNKVNIYHRKRHYPHLLSGGERQRVAIARALVSDPLFLLADEPTGNLDSDTGMEIMKLLKGLNEEGKSIVMVTHNKDWIPLANRVIQLRDGEITDEVR